MNLMFSVFDVMCVEMMGKKVIVVFYICNCFEINVVFFGGGG